MRHILLESLLLGVDDLLGKRLPALQSFANGAANVKLLTSQRARLAALPAALRGRPLAEELGLADGRHDGLGASIWLVIEAYLRHPDMPPETIEAAKRIQATIIPTLDDLTVTYEAEARAAKENKDALTDLKKDLDLFPVPSGTLYDWAVSFVAAGEQLGILLSTRADAKDRVDATKLRATMIGTLNRLRKSLAAEQQDDPSLPADLDAQVFAYFDLLEEKAAAAAAEAKKAEAKKAEAKKAKGTKAAEAAKTPEAVAPPVAPAAGAAAAPAAGAAAPDGSIVGNG
jgi:hypothetical protein